jgi:hypothetical protein
MQELVHEALEVFLVETLSPPYIYHSKGDVGLIGLLAILQNVHVFHEVLEINLHLPRQYHIVIIKVERSEQPVREELGCAKT